MQVRLIIVLLALSLSISSCLGKGQPKVEVEWVKMVTGPDKNHFFGYYGVNVWNDKMTHVLALEVDRNDALPEAGEKAVIGLAEIATGQFTPLTSTTAWNLQQGCMLFWNPQKPNEEFYFNDIVDGKLVSIRYNIPAKSRTVMPYTISGLSKDGRYAVHMNYGRISRLRKVVSYNGTSDPNPNEAHPENDGVFIVDMLTGESRLLVSYADMARDIKQYAPEVMEREMWVEHAEFSRSGSRILFLPRTVDSTGLKLETGLYTIDFDGSNMKCNIPYGSSVSHFGWRNDNEIAVTYSYDKPVRRHMLVDDNGMRQTIGELKWDGHCSFDKTGEWVLTDGDKDNKNHRNNIWMFHLPSQTTHKIHTFEMLEPRFLSGDARCDLHPRISKNNSMICADALDPETGLRQIYIIKIKTT